jgi:hypothetical protein
MGLQHHRAMRLALVMVIAACNLYTGPTSTETRDAASDSREPWHPPGMVTIRVRNDGTRTLYVQASGWSGQAYLSIRKAGGDAVASDSCEVCNCETCPSCAVCGRALAAVQPLAPSESIEYRWDQADWVNIAEGCRPTLACEQPMLVPAGPLTARTTYSTSFTETTIYGARETFIGPPLTADTVFMHPATDIVLVPIL